MKRGMRHRQRGYTLPPDRYPSAASLWLCAGIVAGVLFTHGIWLHYVRDATCFTEAPTLTDEQVAEILYQLDDNKE